MDISKPPGAMALQKIDQREDNARPPFFPSEKNNAIHATRKPRVIASRYKDGISSALVSRPSTPKRCPSPNATCTFSSPGMSLPKRAQSAERRRPMTPTLRVSAPSSPSRPSTLSSPSRPSTPSSPSKPSTPSSPSRLSTPSSPSSRSMTPVLDATTGTHKATQRLLGNRPMEGLWPSMRSLSSSLQSEALTVSISKIEKLAVHPSSDKIIKSLANVVTERKRTPFKGRNTSDQLENSKPAENPNTRVIEQHRWPGMISGKLSANVSSRSVDQSDKICRSASPRAVSPTKTKPSSDGTTTLAQLTSGEVAEQLLNNGGGKVEQDMNSLANSSLPSDRYPVVLRPIRTQSSPIPVLHRPSSPTKVLSSLSTTRGMLSPSWTRPSTPTTPFSATSRGSCMSSVFNYNIDIRKGKKNASYIENAHQLRLLYNVSLQWHFVNAQADKILAIQKIMTENVLCSVWNRYTELRDSVIVKRIDVQHLQQEMKLYSILKEHMAYLEHFASVQKVHYSALSGAAKGVKASTLRVPIRGGARADVVHLKNVVNSAINIMQSMSSSINYLLSKVEDTKSLVSELSAITAREKFMLDDCRELLDLVAAMQVQESSLRTHIIQHRQDSPKLD
ncbi:AUGMIN subunit 8 [Canna indica]|uniref:AUGMIN subunit 8 n=1 Tax=Canna indica TaxID=4628 RepID=A0AAQ3JNG7_9LILI|nr:AUGMIN subunit 8 [Canna indica]